MCLPGGSWGTHECFRWISEQFQGVWKRIKRDIKHVFEGSLGCSKDILGEI